MSRNNREEIVPSDRLRLTMRHQQAAHLQPACNTEARHGSPSPSQAVLSGAADLVFVSRFSQHSLGKF